jgi:hypothetical protein
MTLSSARFLVDKGNPALQYHDEFGWRQIGAGLRIVSRGYCVLLLGSILSGALVWMVLTGRSVFGLGEGPHGDELLLTLTGLTIFLTAVFSYGLVMYGQWRCMLFAPPRNSAKEVMYVCFHCVLVGSVLNAIGAYLDGGKTYAALQHGWEGLQELDPWSASNIMQIASILLGIIGSLVFSQYLRNVAECFSDRRGARAVDFNLWFMGLMIGGSVGAQLCVRQLALKWDTVPYLAAGWLLCFGWHLWLVLRVRRCVENGLLKAAQDRAPGPVAGAVAVLKHTLSGLHRLARGTSA